MSVLIDEGTKVIVQGITGNEGRFHTKRCIEYGTKVVGGVTPGKGGQSVEGVPVFDTVYEAVEKTGADASLIFVPAPFAGDAMLEAIDAGIRLIVCITEGIPTFDMMIVRQYLKKKGAVLIGPNCPGIISPGKCKVGIMPHDAFMPGEVGIVSRSGTLTYETSSQLTSLGIGQSTCIGIGGDPIVGLPFKEALPLFEEDPGTKLVVLIGEIGGVFEQEACEVIKDMKKPVVAFIAGASAPPGKRMGHAGAIITGSSGRAEEKKRALREAGAIVVDSPADIGITVKEVLSKM